MQTGVVNFDAMMDACRKQVNYSAVKWHDLWGHYSLTMRLFGPHPAPTQLDAFYEFAVLRSPTLPSDSSALRDSLHAEVTRKCQLAEYRQAANWCLLTSIAEFEPLDAVALRKRFHPEATPERGRVLLSVVLYERRSELTAHTETRLGLVRTRETMDCTDRFELETTQSIDLAMLSPHRRRLFESCHLLDAETRADAP